MKPSISLFATAAIFTCLALAGSAESRSWVGKELPVIALDYLGDEPDTKGKPAVVEFWTTWARPCVATIPHLNAISRKFKETGLIVVAITDEKKEAVERFRKSQPMDYNVAISPEGTEKKLGITGLPHAFIVGKDGKVVWEGNPMRLTDAEIEKALK